MTKFSAGNTYTGHFICDSDTVISVKVLRRTAKTVRVMDLDGNEEKTCRIQEHDGVEFIYPMGSGYSMAPRIRADREA